MPKIAKKIVKKEVKKEVKLIDNTAEKIEKLDNMLKDVSDILGYHLERIQMLESEQEHTLSKLSQACNRLGI